MTKKVLKFTMSCVSIFFVYLLSFSAATPRDHRLLICGVTNQVKYSNLKYIKKSMFLNCVVYCHEFSRVQNVVVNPNCYCYLTMFPEIKYWVPRC